MIDSLTRLKDQGLITINDLELLGVCVNLRVWHHEMTSRGYSTENCVPLTECDNTSASAWVRGKSPASRAAVELMSELDKHAALHGYLPMCKWIAGTTNELPDYLSRLISERTDDMCIEEAHRVLCVNPDSIHLVSLDSSTLQFAHNFLSVTAKLPRWKRVTSSISKLYLDMHAKGTTSIRARTSTISNSKR